MTGYRVADSMVSPEKKGYMLPMKIRGFKIRRFKTRGFSLIEMMIVLAITVIIATFTFISVQPALRDARVNAGYNLTLMTMRRSRQTAVDTRKTYIVTFVVPQTIQVWRQDAGSPLPAPVLINAYTLPYDIEFKNVAGIPNTATTTPDQFGTGAYPIDFDINVGGGAGTSIYFKPDGGAYDLAGNVNNGVLYIARPTELYSSRAITMFGLTGRIKGWRLNKNTTAGTSEWQPQ
jgi:prepilin-type N-terminal cleavage/methylation domain-containing protein